MKICRDCSHACDNALNACPRCGSTNLALVAEKHCVYCKTRVAMGTIICPQCHRILPPESDDIQAQNYVTTPTSASSNAAGGGAATVGLANVNAGESGSGTVAENDNIKVVQPITHISQQPESDVATYGENIQYQSAYKQAQPESTSGISDYDKTNPLFAIYDNTPDILPIAKKEEGVPATTYSENVEMQESLQADISAADGYNNTGVLQTKEYQTVRISREEEKPQSKLPRMLLFLLGCVYTIIGFCTTYMVHDFGNISGWNMACSVIIKLRDMFPSTYPYILYGSNFLAKFENLGSYMPFFMDHAIMFALAGGITMMISAVPKWVVSVLHFTVVACHIGGVCMMGYLFGFGCVGVGAYLLVCGSIAVAVLHILFVDKVYKPSKI